MPVIVINDDAHYQRELTQAGPSKLVVVDFTATWYVISVNLYLIY